MDSAKISTKQPVFPIESDRKFENFKIYPKFA